MRTALGHARDALCLFGAVALILYITLVPHRPDGSFVPSDAGLTASAVFPGGTEAESHLIVADGTASPEVVR